MMKKHGGSIPTSEVVALSDQLKLYILNSSSDLSFHFKFLDVINGNLDAFSDGGVIDKEK